jgi:hypothetical protein
VRPAALKVIESMRPALKVVESLECERGPGETLYDTARRLITVELLGMEGEQKRASRRANCSLRQFHHYCVDLGITPKQQKRRLRAVR